MYCTDFEFDGELLSDHGFMICQFDGNDNSWSGGEVTFITSKPPYQDRQDYYTYSYDTPITITFSVCKNTCENDDREMYITQDDYSDMSRWLCRQDGYHWLRFDQEGWEDVFYNSYINITPYQINGRTLGFNITVTTDSPYAYSQEYKYNFNFDTNNIFTFKNYSDAVGSIYVDATIIPKENGNIEFVSGNDEHHCLTKINNVGIGDEIRLNGNNDILVGITNPNNFNFVFPIVANSYKDRTTYFDNAGVNCDITIKFRNKRMVMV